MSNFPIHVFLLLNQRRTARLEIRFHKWLNIYETQNWKQRKLVLYTIDLIYYSRSHFCHQDRQAFLSALTATAT